MTTALQPYYKPKHFRAEEFVPPALFKALAAKNDTWKVWVMMDEGILRFCDWSREKMGALTINNWVFGGDREESGLRVPGQKHYSDTTQHKFGRAVDIISKVLHGSDMRKIVRKHEDEVSRWVTTLENTLGGKQISWMHADRRNAGPGILLLDI